MQFFLLKSLEHSEVLENNGVRTDELTDVREKQSVSRIDGREKNRQTMKRTDRQTIKRTERQAVKRTDRQIDR